MSPLNLVRAGVLVTAAAALLGAAPAAAAGPVDVAAIDAGGARSYWTAERMREAEPLPIEAAGPADAPPGAPRSAGAPAFVDPTAAGSSSVPQLEQGSAGAARADGGYRRSEVADPSGEAVRMHGKVFLTIEGGAIPGDYVCSGTALSSHNESVVWSAGHCVFDTEGGGYASNWLFVPAYDGSAPYGEWPAVKLSAPDDWRKDANLSYDLGAAVVAKNGSGRTLTDVVGGRGIGFNQKRNQRYSAFGYPAEQPPLEFSGDREFRCDAGLGGTDNPGGSGPPTNWIGCDMTGGSSGGGWVAGGAVLGLNSYSYCLVLLCEERMYGPYFDDTAKRLYKGIAGEAEYCRNRKVTMLGSDGADRLEGTSGRDVIKAGGGRDEIAGEGGRDTVCGGGGRDRIEGGGGKDRLSGNGGADKLRGGGGRDRCNGGGGRDRARGCERAKKIR